VASRSSLARPNARSCNWPPRYPEFPGSRTAEIRSYSIFFSPALEIPELIGVSKTWEVRRHRLDVDVQRSAVPAVREAVD
jgi:hypothetical protein